MRTPSGEAAKPTCSAEKESGCFWPMVCGYLAGVGTAILAVTYIVLNIS